jgi:RNA methyltransferase, TrmH family
MLLRLREAIFAWNGVRNVMKASSHDRLRRIEGRHNSLVKELRRAFDRSELTESGACAVDGLRIVEEAIRSGLKFEAVFFSESAENKAERLLPQLAGQVETLLLPDKLFASAVPSDSPQGVAALVRPKIYTVDDVLRANQKGPIVVLGGIQDPGNLGTVLRSGEAFGAAGVLMGENTVSLFNAKVVRGSAGSVFRIPATRTKMVEAIAKIRASGVRMLATSSHKRVPLDAADLSTPIAIFIGSEGAGLPRDVLSEMDDVIAIPHSSQVESLNAGVAASIVLYEAARQRKEYSK